MSPIAEIKLHEPFLSNDSFLQQAKQTEILNHDPLYSRNE